MHDLSRPARLALTLLLTVAILLPLLVLAPRYLSWQIATEGRRVLTTANTADTLAR